MNGIVALVFWTIFALANPVFLLRLKRPEQVLLSASIVSMPWMGGLWLSPVQLDLRLTYIFLLGSLVLSFNSAAKFDRKQKVTALIITPGIVMVVWAAISAFQAYRVELALGGAVILGFNLLYFVVINKNMKKMADVEWMTKSVFLSLFYCSLLAVLQYKIRFFSVGFVDLGFNTFMFWRTRSTFMHANQFGMFQLLILPVLFRQLIIQLRLRKQKTFYIYLGLFLLSLFTLYTTGNRGSWVGFGIGMVVVILLDLMRSKNKKMKRIMLRVIFSILFLTSIAGFRYGDRIYDRFFAGSGQSSASEQAEHRENLNVGAYQLLEDNPILGVGMYNFNFYADVIFTHNLYLLIASEIGYPGLFILFWFVLGFLINGIKAIRSTNFYVADMGKALLTVVVAFLIASYPGPDYWQSPQISGTLWTVVAISIGLTRRFNTDSFKFQQKQRQEMLRKQRQFRRVNTETVLETV
ncbi:O-antigen ligase family protein [bacterium]|nr:O-antigen ligase family protein [bacterium]